MSGLMLFEFRGRQVRTLEIDGQPWFVGKDVAEILGYSNPQKAVRDHCKRHRPVGVNDSFTLDPQTVIIPESDVYRLVMRSRLPEAEAFEAWVTEDVLPTIRRTGSYSLHDRYGPTTMIGGFLVPTTYAGVLRLAADQAEEIERQKAVIQELTPKAEFHDRVASSEDGLSIADVAKTLGTGEIRLFRWLRENGILLSTRHEWNLPRQEYLDRGYFKLQKQTWTDKAGQGHISTKTLVTGKGLIWLQQQWDADNRPSDTASRRPQLSVVQ